MSNHPAQRQPQSLTAWGFRGMSNMTNTNASALIRTSTDTGEPVSASRCDRCGEVVTDIDAGFSLGLHGYAHDCGGTWRVVGATGFIVDDETAADVGPEEKKIAIRPRPLARR